MTRTSASRRHMPTAYLRASGPNGRGYFAVVLGAYSASGHSVFAIAEPGGWQSYPRGTDVEPC